MNKKILNAIESANLYTLKYVNGVKCIHILGYYYKTDEGWGEDKYWRYLEFCGLEMPLSDYLAGSIDDRDIWESECKQYITDLTEEEVLVYFTSDDAPIPMYIEDIPEHLPNDIFIDTLY